MHNWQNKCYQFFIGKGFNRRQASQYVFNFVRDNMDIIDFHFDVDIRVTTDQLVVLLTHLTLYYKKIGLDADGKILMDKTASDLI
jgi:hypothetical protein